MQRIEEIEQPIVGETYLVPCIRGEPVVGTPHTDHDHFQCTPYHWHHDSRFVDNPRTATAAREGDVPEYLPRVCLNSEVVAWPIGNYGQLHLERQAPGAALMALYLGYNKMKAPCGHCPHKGMPIQNGVCTGHRLKWLPDGTIAHKPPYTLSIRGTQSKVVMEDYPENGQLSITLTDDVRDTIILDFHDRDGDLVAWHDMDINYAQKGDRINMNPRECRA